MKRILVLLLVSIAAGIGHPLAAESGDAERTERDNTAVNIRDRNAQAMTADRQGLNRSDTELIAEIRSSLLKDDSLSTYAQNVKVLADHGKVVLRGPVRSIEERDRVGQKAVEIAGVLNVQNNLEIAPHENS